MLRDWEILLHSILDNPEVPISGVEYIERSALRSLLFDYQGERIQRDEGVCAHQVIALQARRNPDAIAACCGDEQLTYAELEERSNEIAHYLRNIGVYPEARVAVYLDRGVSLLISFIAVMKAGGV